MLQYSKYMGFLAAFALVLASCGGGGSTEQSSSENLTADVGTGNAATDVATGNATTDVGTGKEVANALVVTTAVAVVPTAGSKPSTSSPDQNTKVAGTITTVEDTIVKVVYYGNGADYITTVRYGSTLCAKTDSSNYPEVTRTYTCQGISNVSQNEIEDYVIANYESTSKTLKTNIYTQSQTFWKSYVGISYIDSLYNYIYYYNDGPPIISLNVKSLSGDEIDLPAGGAFNYVRLNGAAGVFTCDKILGENYNFQCPSLPVGSYTLNVSYNGGISEASFLQVIYVSDADTSGYPTEPTLPDLF